LAEGEKTKGNRAMDIRRLVCHQKESLYRVLDTINQNGKGIVFAVDDAGRFVGTISDGDIRRAILAKCSLEAPATDILDHGSPLFGQILALVNREDVKNKLIGKSISARVGTPLDELLTLVDRRIRIIPLLDGQERVEDYFEYKSAFYAPVSSPIFQGNELAYLVDCIESNWISSQGRYVADLETQFARFCGAAHGVAVSSGTAALHLALAALGVGPGDEVILPDLTFAATANAVIYTGATPVLVDIDPGNWCIDPARIEAHITSRTRAIIPVHLYGRPADMTAISAIARRHDLVVVEDCAEAMGATIDRRRVGGFGHVGCFSFFANKIMTTGEGGMCVCADGALARRMRTLRDHGMSPGRKYWHETVGFNYRMTNLQAAIGVAQLERIDHLLGLREWICRHYDRTLGDLPLITAPRRRPGTRNVTWLASYLLDPSVDRETFIDAAGGAGIDIRPFFYPLSDMPPFRHMAPHFTPNAHSVSARGVNLPTSPSFKPAVYNRIADTLIRILSNWQATGILPNGAHPEPSAVGRCA
jgi:perosamine synthetase